MISAQTATPLAQLELKDLKERLERSALRPVEQAVFLVFWLLAEGGGRSLVEGRVVDVALTSIRIAGFQLSALHEWVFLAQRLGFSARQCARIEEGLKLSALAELEDVRSIEDLTWLSPKVADELAQIQSKRLREVAFRRPVRVAEILEEKKRAKECQRQRMLSFFTQLESSVVV